MNIELDHNQQPKSHNRSISLGGQAIDFFNMYFRPRQSARQREEAFYRTRDNQHAEIDAARERLFASRLPLIIWSETPLPEVLDKFMFRSKELPPNGKDKVYNDLEDVVGSLNRLMDGSFVGVTHDREQPTQESYTVIDPEWLNGIKFVYESTLSAMDSMSVTEE